MPILKRDDGIQFAIHTYRELLQPAKISVLRNDIRNLALNHGEYVRLFKLPTGQIEAVFSRDPGFLLGEAVWEYFGKPTDLIYCEALADGQSAILVVVRGGSVYLDTKIPLGNIIDELASLVAGDNHYHIYIYGDVPISESKQRGKFVFSKDQIASFNVLEKPLFPHLPITESLQLQPLELALNSPEMRRVFHWKRWAIGAVILLIGFGVYHWLTAPKPKPVPQRIVTTPAVPINPYASYIAALKTPAPEKQTAEFTAVVNTVYLLPGWQATSVTFKDGTYTIPLTSLGGSVTMLNQWAKSHQMQLTLSAAGATLLLRSRLTPRPETQTIYRSSQLIYFIIDKMDQVLPQRSVSIGAANTVTNYQTTALTIQLSNIAPAVLNLIGRQLTNLPVKITQIQSTLAPNGLLNGTIALTVLGN